MIARQKNIIKQWGFLDESVISEDGFQEPLHRGWYIYSQNRRRHRSSYSSSTLSLFLDSRIFSLIKFHGFLTWVVFYPRLCRHCVILRARGLCRTNYPCELPSLISNLESHDRTQFQRQIIRCPFEACFSSLVYRIFREITQVSNRKQSETRNDRNTKMSLRMLGCNVGVKFYDC